jgi:hypothetical protein
MNFTLSHTRGPEDSLVVDEEHLAAFSSNEAHDVVPVFRSEHHIIKESCPAHLSARGSRIRARAWAELTRWDFAGESRLSMDGPSRHARGEPQSPGPEDCEAGSPG